MSEKIKERIEWLALLRGLNILLVVMFHVQLIDMSTGNNHSFCSDICLPFNPIRMPLFIFCSGGLLYISRIRKEWKVSNLYIDKINRIVIPFVFFVTFYYFFKLLLNPFIKTKITFSITDYLDSFCFYYGHPSAHLWFLPVLFWFMLLYPFFRWLCLSKLRMSLFLIFCIFFYFVDFTTLADYNYFCILSLNNFLIYFFSGILFFRYNLYKYLQNSFSLLFIAVLYGLSYWYNIPLLTSLLGILLMILICQQITKFYPSLFSSFREYIYQIFLMSFIFQPFVELILWKKIFYNEHFFFFFYILNVLFGIFMPVLLTKFIENSKNKWLKRCIGLST